MPSGNSGKSWTTSTTIQSMPASVPGTMIGLVWFRRDLRVHDHPPLRAALDACERVVPVFVLDDALLRGRHASEHRTRSCTSACTSCAVRCASAAATSWSPAARPNMNCPSWRVSTVRAPSISRPTSRRSRCTVTSGSRKRCARRASSRAARPATSWPTSASRSRTRSSRRSGARGSSCRAERSTARPQGPGAGESARRRAPARQARLRRREGRPRAHARLAARRHRRLRGQPRPARRRHLDAFAVPALRLSLGARARGEGRRPRRVHPPARLARLLRPRPAPQPRATRATPISATSTPSSGTAPTSTSTPGARAARAIRWSTPACASSPPRAGCTTARG